VASFGCAPRRVMSGNSAILLLARQENVAIERPTVCRLPNSEPLFEAELAVQLLDYGVAFARGHFEFVAVHDVDSGAAVLDGFALLQYSGSEGDTWSVGAEHGGKKIVRERETARADAVVGHEEPAGEALLHFMKAIARGGLRDLHTLQDGVAVEAHLKLGSGLESGLQRASGDAEAVALDLYDHPKRTLVQTDGQCGAYRAFATHDAGFDGPATTHGNDDGRQTTVQKMDIRLFLVGLVKAEMAGQIEELKVGAD
jgi:hypothetical protein